MKENQKDNRNQQSDSKSHQEQTQDGKKKAEINPNNPKANQDKQKDSKDNKQSQGLPSPKAGNNTTVSDKDDVEEATSEKTESRNIPKGNSK